MLKNTGAMCMVEVPDSSREEGFRLIDMGNYYADGKGENYLITSLDLAKKYGHLVKEKVYTPKAAFNK
jgi:hypothetical protein